jgi:riboflavin synthase
VVKGDHVFTGLVAELGTVTAVRRTADGAHLTVGGSLASQMSRGDSVAVNGVCLTATAANATSFEADVVEETLRRSSLGAAREGTPVNLELALRASDRLGGHVVQGHVDGTGTVRSVEREGMASLLSIAADPGLLRYVVEKGSIAVDGISLTVASLGENSFTVSLVPETLNRTSLGAAVPGDTVNLEVDVLAKYVERLAAR